MTNAIKRYLSIWTLILLLAGLAVVGGSALAEAAPTSVKLNYTGKVKVPLGDKLTLTPSLSPEGAATTYTWKTSNKKVATVSGGVVKAKKVGTATITVTTRNKKKAKVKVKVYDPYKPTSVSLNVSGTQSVKAMDYLQLSATLSPESARSTLKWKSSNNKIARVDQNGLVSPVKPGTVTITVTTGNKKTAKVKVKVIDDSMEPITTPADYNLPYVVYISKNSHTLAILAKDDSGAWTRVLRKYPVGTGLNNCTDKGVFTITKKERWHKWTHGYSPYSNKLSVGIHIHGPLYKSMNDNAMYTRQYNGIGTDVTAGCVRCTGATSAWIYYNCPVGTQVIIGQNSRFSASKLKKLKTSKTYTKDPSDPGTNYEILMTGFSVEPASLSLNVGATQTVSPVNITPSTTTTSNFKYSTSNAAVAKVSDNGVVTAVAQGQATIYVSGADDFNYTVAVPVFVGSSYELAEAQQTYAAGTEAIEAAEDETFDFDTEEVDPEVGEIFFGDEEE